MSRPVAVTSRIAFAVGLLRDAVEPRHTAAAAENHGGRALQNFDCFDIVEIAKVFDVVAYAVDEDIRGGDLTAN